MLQEVCLILVSMYHLCVLCYLFFLPCLLAWKSFQLKVVLIWTLTLPLDTFMSSLSSDCASIFRGNVSLTCSMNCSSDISIICLKPSNHKQIVLCHTWSISCWAIMYIVLLAFVPRIVSFHEFVFQDSQIWFIVHHWFKWVPCDICEC